MAQIERDLIKTPPFAMLVMKIAKYTCIFFAVVLGVLTSYLFWMDLQGGALLSASMSFKFAGATLYFVLVTIGLHVLIKKNNLKNELI